MLSYEEALQRVLNLESHAVEVESVGLSESCGRVLAENQHSPINVPPFSNSAMDGYALKAADFVAGSSYEVSQRIAAGCVPEPLAPGTIARIFTGAPMPPGADAVVIQENTEPGDNGQVVLKGDLKPGQNVRAAGDDTTAGELLLAKGERINSRAVGMLANTGIAVLPCYKRLKVALLATGDEIRTPGEPLEPGQIYNSNYFLLRAELDSLGAEVIDCGLCGDSAEATRAALEQASDQSDAVITIGGMSVGEEDYVRDQASSLGEMDFWKVSIKPGKPLGFGKIGNSLFFGLPGNPVSSYVTYFLFAKPALKKTMGMARCENPMISVTADFDYQNRSVRREFVRVKLSEDTALTGALPRARIFRTQSSGVLSSLTFADALAVIEPEQVVKKGDVLKAFSLS